MDATLIKAIQQDFVKSDAPAIRTGMEVKIHQIIKEGNKERTQIFQGLVIKVAWKTDLERMITVRKETEGVSIEKIFPIHSPMVGKIEVMRQFKVRRANIGFIRKLTGKASRLKEVKKAA